MTGYIWRESLPQRDALARADPFARVHVAAVGVAVPDLASQPARSRLGSVA
jgi:hypothetical protein